MKQLIRAALLLGGAILASQSAFAQFTFVQNDLYLGFQNSGGAGSADYIINLGPTTHILGSNTVVDLSSDFSSSLFNNVSLRGTSSHIFGGVVGGQNSGVNGTSDIYLTQLRTSNIGNPALAGSSLTGVQSQSQDDSAEADLSVLNAPGAGTGSLDSSKSWEASVEPANNAGTFLGVTGINPDSQVSTNTALYEDLWVTSDSGDPRGSLGQPFTYLGYFTLDLTGGSPSLTFTSTNVPPTLATKPVIVSVKKTGSTVTVVSSNAVPTFTYQLQFTASLSPTNWMNVGSSVVAGSTMVTNTDATATDTNRFYRVQGH